jgi:zinc/manganese transport system substrate-binding protein
MRRRQILLTLPALAQAARAQAEAAGPVRVVAAFSILGDMVRQIGGDRVALRVIVGPEADAHAFQPRPSDAEALRDADLVVRNGLGFDPWMDRLARAGGHAAPVVTATEGLAPRGLDHPAHDADRRRRSAAPSGGVADPHCWQDLRLGQHYARRIGEGLAAADAGYAARHRAATETYASRLDELDAWVRAQIATVPAARRRVVTGHDSFGYFAAAYGVEFLAPQGVATEAEPSAAQVARLIRLIREQDIKAVFLENIANPATLRRIAAEAGVRVRGRLYADALSGPDGPAPTYEAMFRHNVGLLVPAMRGDAA